MAKTKSTAAPADKRTAVVRIARPADRPYYIWYRCPETNERFRLSTGTRDEAEAEEMRADLEAKLRLGIKQIKRSKVPGDHMPWAEFRWLYTTEKLATQRKRGAECAESRLDISERIIRPKTLSDMASADAMQKLQNKLLEGAESRTGKPRAEPTVCGYMRAVRAALSWARKRGWLEALPQVQMLQLDKGEMRGRPLVGEEVDRMLTVTPKIVGDSVADSWTYLLRGVVNSGLRLGELMNFSWDIPQTIQPRWGRGRLPVLWFPGYLQKNKKTETVPMVPWFEEFLHETPLDERTGWVFEPGSLQVQLGRPIQQERPDAEWVGRVVSRIGKKAGVIVDEGDPRTGRGVKYASTHDLRRTFAVRLHQSRIPPHLITKLMRHSDYRVTERYYISETTQQDAGQIRDILGSVPPNVTGSRTQSRTHI